MAGNAASYKSYPGHQFFYKTRTEKREIAADEGLNR